MARSTFKTLFYINRSKEKKNGKCPIMGRITIDGEQVQYSTGKEIAPELWDSRKGRCKGIGEETKEINRYLQSKEEQAKAKYQELVWQRGYITAELLKRELLEEGELCIKGRRMKTKTPYRVQVLPPAQTIMNRYRGIRAGFVFDVPTTDVILNGMHYIQRNIGMKTPLTFHMARHTFASLITLSAGVPIETVSRMLGHTNLRTTQIYAAVSSERIHRDMQKVQQRIQDTFTLKL